MFVISRSFLINPGNLNNTSLLYELLFLLNASAEFNEIILFSIFDFDILLYIMFLKKYAFLKSIRKICNTLFKVLTYAKFYLHFS